MESVTQQNSAAAEESTAASEELNAQAEAMIEMVLELKNLIDGGKTKSPTNVKTGMGETAAPVFKAHPTSAIAKKKSLPTPRRKAVAEDPEKIIPLDGADEFEDF